MLCGRDEKGRLKGVLGVVAIVQDAKRSSAISFSVLFFFDKERGYLPDLTSEGSLRGVRW